MENLDFFHRNMGFDLDENQVRFWLSKDVLTYGERVKVHVMLLQRRSLHTLISQIA